MKKILLLFTLITITPHNYCGLDNLGLGGDVGAKAAQEIGDSLKTTAKIISKSVAINTKKMGDSLTKNTDTLAESIVSLTNSVDNSILNKEKFSLASKEFHFSLLGMVIGCFGGKVLYDSICELSEKINLQENQNKSWYHIVSRRDFIKPVCGVLGLLAGLSCIAKSDSLARHCTSV